MRYQCLTDEQVNHFVEHGYIILRGALDPGLASRCVDQGFARLGYDRDDPSTWRETRIHMPQTTALSMEQLSPMALAAAGDLAGGMDRLKLPWQSGDAFIFNLGIGKNEPWRPPGPKGIGWHKDGDFFVHFLDSPEQALLSILCWTDMIHQGGATFIAPDSVGVVARFLADHPEGVVPGDPLLHGLIGKCREFVELTASAGDVVFHHPFMLHTSSQNILGVERAITNPSPHLREPMNFNRADPAEHSPVERAVLRGLGVDHFDFKPTGSRRNVTPARVALQQKMLEEEKTRAAALMVAGASPA